MLRQTIDDGCREIVLVEQTLNIGTIPFHILFSRRYQRLDQMLDGLADFMGGMVFQVNLDRCSQPVSRRGKQLGNKWEAADIHRRIISC